MPEIAIDRRFLQAAPGLSVLDVARENHIFIPTLCHHPGLGAYGACRLCLVEVVQGGRSGLTSSCTLPAADGLAVETASPAVLSARRTTAELLLARAPNSETIRTLALSLGVTSTTLEMKDEDCILCGRCVRACRALGIGAIDFAGRGEDRRPAVPFDRPSKTCIACQACLTVCPTGAIHAVVAPEAIEMREWKTRQELELCADCGRPTVTARQRTRLAGITPEEQHERQALCPTCRRRA